MNAIFFENGDIVGTQDAILPEETALFENHGFNGEANEVAALHTSTELEDPRVTAVRLTLQFVHDSINGNLAVHVSGFLSGCLPLQSQNFITKSIRVNRGLWNSEIKKFKMMMIECLGEDAFTPAVMKAVAGITAEIGECNQPRLAALQLARRCGIELRDGESSTAIAKKFGTSKQAFQQGGKKFAERFRLVPMRANRKHTDRFTTTNYRHPKNHEHTTIAH
jgi:hypothetical protein